MTVKEKWMWLYQVSISAENFPVKTTMFHNFWPTSSCTDSEDNCKNNGNNYSRIYQVNSLTT